MPLSQRGEADPHHPVIVWVVVTLDETGALGTIDQLDCAVVPEEQVPGDVTDARRRAVTPHGQ